MDKNAENGYYLDKWISDSYTLQYYHKIGRDFIKASELMYDALYLNPYSNSKQWYTPY